MSSTKGMERLDVAKPPYQIPAKILRFLQDKQIEVSRIHLLPYHDTGTGKYRQLGRVVETGFHAPDEEETKHLLDLFVSAGYPKVRIGG